MRYTALVAGSGLMLISLAGGMSAVAYAQPAPATPAAAPAPVVAAPTQPAGVKSVVLAADTDLRCGGSEFMYVVSGLKAGAKLSVLGQADKWLKVEYPAGTRALVLAVEAEGSADGKTAKLRKPSKLNALNAAQGWRASYMHLLPDEAPAGTVLNVVEIAKNEDGSTGGYIIEAPGGSFGFVNASAVRKDDGAAPTTPVSPNGPSTTPANGTKATEPGKVVGTTPGIGGSSTPGTGAGMSVPPAPVGEGSTPVAPGGAGGEPETPVVEPAKVEPIKVEPSKTELMMALFKKVMQKGSSEASLDEAMGQFKAYINTLSDTPRDKNSKAMLERYVMAMQTRKDLLADVRAAEEKGTTITTRVSELKKTITELESQRHYTIIGRLVPSVVYDGQHLPMLYRIESPEPGSARTLGYLQPDDRFDLTGKLGIVVGIEGETRFEEALKANVITPRNIDQISLEPVSGKVVRTESLVKTSTTAKPADAKKDSPSSPGELPKMKPIADPNK